MTSQLNFSNTLQKDNQSMILHIDSPSKASLQIDVTEHREEIIKMLPFDSIEDYFTKNRTIISKSTSKRIANMNSDILLPILNVMGWHGEDEQ